MGSINERTVEVGQVLARFDETGKVTVSSADLRYTRAEGI
jgi:hypothetical protein